MTDRMTKDEHIALLKTAIAANLTVRIEHDKRLEAERQGNPPKFKIWFAKELEAANRTRLELEDIIADPVRHALRKQLNGLGQRLYNLLGSTKPMPNLAEEIADLTPRPDHAISIIDSAWNGVGKDNDRWWS
jgi:hypothetical protein